MENKIKRFLSLLLALVMVIGLMPVGHVHAEEAIKAIGEKVTSVEADVEYVICLTGTMNALTNEQGSGDWQTHTLATANCSGEIQDKFIWTLETAEGGFKVKNVNGYINVSRNTANLNETGHVFELTYTDNGWAIKSLETNEYFNNLGDSGSIGGWSGDGTKFDIYTVAEKSMDEIDPWGKRNWVKVSVETETVKDAYEGLFEYAWDRNPGTIWHSNWQGTEDKLTGENTFAGVIDFTKVYTISQFSFTPRVGNNSGRVTQASLYVKETEDAEWILVAEHATFENNGDKKDINFDAQPVRYVKFVAEQSSDGWVAVSEFDIDYIAPAVHEHNPAVAVKENEQDATCTEDGSYDSVVYCSECGEELSRETNTVKALGHKPATMTGYPATCTTPGLSDGSYCERCDETITKQEPIDPLGHKPATMTGYPATCTTPGLSDGSYCERCDETITKQEPIDALGHNYENGACTRCGEAEPAAPVVAEKITGITGEASSVDTSEPAHNKDVVNAFDGDTNTFWATVPGGTLADAYLIADLGATYSISRVDYTKRFDSGAKYGCTGNLLDYIIEVSVDGETWTEVAKGDTVDGTTEITFDAVNARYVKLTATKSYHWQEANANTVMTVAEFEVYGIAVEVHEHAPAEPVPENEKPATCTEDGSYDSVVYCSECGEELSRETIPVKALGHDYKVVKVVDPTCTTSGYTVYGCTRCDKTYKDDPTEPQHTWDEGEFREPTCSEMGCMVYTCTLCGYKYEMEGTYVPAVDHIAADEPAKENEKPATCTEDGSYEAVYKCKFCDLEMKRETIPVKALGHDYKVVKVVDPTCTASGYTIYGCTRCDKTYKDDPTEPEHTWDEGEFREPTCSEMGCMVYTCTLCGYKYEMEGTYVPAVDHIAADEPAKENEKPATCTEDGSYEAVYKCKFCDLEMKRETIPVKALGHNYEDGTCTNCGEAEPVDPEKLTGIVGEDSSTDTSEPAYDKSVGNAFDGDYNTFWATVPGGNLTDAYLIADLGAEFIVSRVDYTKRFDSGAKYGCTGNLLDYIIEVSVDGETWTKVANGDTVDGTTEITFEGVNARYVKLTATKSYHWDAPQANTVMTVAELEVYGLPVNAGHTHTPAEPVPENEKPATCTEDGSYDSVVYCSECKEELSRETLPIKALGHKEEPVKGTPATFDEPGLSDGKICSVCGETLEAQKPIDALDYNDGTIPVSALTATAGDSYATDIPENALDGNLATMWHTDWYGTSSEGHWIQFEITGDYLVDGLRYKPRTDLNREGQPQLNGTITEYKIQVSNDGITFEDVTTGTWDANQKWKTVEFDAQYVKYIRLVSVNACTDNDSVFASAAEIRLTGEETEHVHRYTSVVTEPTCTEKGYTTYTCECGHSYTADETDPLGHKDVAVDGKPATCTEAGMTAGKKCSVCNVVLEGCEEIEALGHDFVNGDCSRCDETLTSKFEDVPAGAFYFDPVEWAVAKGVTTGATATTFNPNGDCQRAQVVTFLWRAAGSPEPTKTENPFIDVKETDFYYKAVLWAVEKNITNGLTADTFGPFALCNRAQVVTFLWRSQGSPASTAEVNFTDVVAGQFYSTAVAWAVENNITNGISATEFGVGGTCNRAQVVTFLYRTYVK